NKAQEEESKISDQISAQIRKSSKTPLADLAKQFNLLVAQTRAVTATDPLLEFGTNSKDVNEAIFRLREGEVSQPIRTDRGYVVLSLKQVQPIHQGTLEEVRDKIITALKQEKSVELARTKAGDLSKRVKSGEKFDSAAKSLGLEPKTSEDFSRAGSVPNV